MAYKIDQEVKAIIDACYQRARTILTERRALMDKIAGVLLEREVLDAEDFAKLMEDDAEKQPQELPELPDERIDILPNTSRDFLA